MTRAAGSRDERLAARPDHGRRIEVRLADALVAVRPLVVPVERVRIPLAPGDVVLAAPGEAIAAGAPLVERLREPELVETAVPEASDLRSGAPAPAVTGGRRVARRRFPIGGRTADGPPRSDEGPGPEAGSVGPAPNAESAPEHDPTANPPGNAEPPSGGGASRRSSGELLFRRKGRWLIVRGDRTDTGVAPIGGTVAAVHAGRAVEIATVGWRIPGTAVLGDPTFGPLAVARDGGDGRAPALDVDLAGAIVVVEGRIDAETIGRARAMGLRGIVVGSLAGRVRRAVEASEARQRTALHPRRPFAVLVLDGELRRPIPDPVRELLAGLVGRPVGIVGDPPGLVVEGPLPRIVVSPDRVVVRSGRWAGTEGQLLGLAGVWRFAAGVHLLAARIATDDGEELVVPVADLVRYGGPS